MPASMPLSDISANLSIPWSRRYGPVIGGSLGGPTMAAGSGEQTSGLAPGGVAGVTTVPELARLLRQLRRRDARQRGAAELTYRELAAKTGAAPGRVRPDLPRRAPPPP